MGHDSVALGYPTPTDFRRLTSCQRNPRNRDVTRREITNYVFAREEVENGEKRREMMSDCVFHIEERR